MGKGEGRELKARTHTATFITLVSTRGSPEQGRGAPKPRDEGPFSTPKPRAFISTPTKHSCGQTPTPASTFLPPPRAQEGTIPSLQGVGGPRLHSLPSTEWSILPIARCLFTFGATLRKPVTRTQPSSGPWSLR